MDLRVAQLLIQQVAENPASKPDPEQVLEALCTVLVRNELLGAKPRQVVISYLGAGEQ